MKKLLAILLSMLMLCTMIPFASVSAADEPTIVVETVEVANAGDQIEVSVSLKNNPGVISAKVEIDYDRSVLELMTEWVYDEELEEDVERYMIVKGAGWSDNYITYPEINAGAYCLMNFINGTAKKDVTKELFFTATFKVKDNAVSGTYPLTIIYDSEDFFNLDGDDVAFGKQDATITINGVKPECKHEYANACDATCMICGELTNPDATHNVKHVAAVEATCETKGNLEYWYCDICGQAWLDAEGTQNTNLKAVVLPLTDHAYYFECDTHCINCGEKTNPSGKHSITHVEAVEATCQATGNREYWTCEYCHTVWLDEEHMAQSNMLSIITYKDHEYTYECDKVCSLCGEITNEAAEHVYDDYLDVDCNLCGKLRKHPAEVFTATATSISEELNSLAFSFTMKATGATVESVNKYVNGSALVSLYGDGAEFTLVKMGAVVSNQQNAILDLENLNGSKTVNVEAVRLLGVDAEAGTLSFAARIKNIPNVGKNVTISARPYFVFADAEGNELIVYGNTVASTYKEAAALAG